MSKSSLLPRELWIDDWFHAGVDNPLRIFSGFLPSSLALGSRLPALFYRFWKFWIRCKQEERKPRNQDFVAAAARSVSCAQIQSGPEALPGFKC